MKSHTDIKIQDQEAYQAGPTSIHTVEITTVIAEYRENAILEDHPRSIAAEEREQQTKLLLKGMK